MSKKSIFLTLVVLGLLIPQVSLAQVVNVLNNSNFEEDEPIPGTNFGTWVPAAGTGSEATIVFSDSIDGSGCLYIEPQGTSSYNFYVIGKNITCEQDETYTLSFWAKAAEARTIQIQLKGGGNETPAFCTIVPELTTDWAEYKITDVNPHAVVLKMDMAVGGTIPLWIDYMLLYKGEAQDTPPGGRIVTLKATDPYPTTGDLDAPQDAMLSWTPSAESAAHNVYLGTSFDDVNSADENSDLLIGDGLPGSTIDPNLDFGTRYFWRVDSISAADEVSKGGVWTFTTRSYIGIDSFEQYNDVNQFIFDTWVDGYYEEDDQGNVVYQGNGSAALISLNIDKAKTGSQCMKIEYNNQSDETYLEVTNTFAGPQDWTAEGVTTLNLSFFGYGFNPGQLYVKINDNKIPYVGYGDNLQNEYWIGLNVDLTALPDANNVTSLIIGVDNVDQFFNLYIDDLRLYAQAPVTVVQIPTTATMPVIDGEVEALWGAAKPTPTDTLRDGAVSVDDVDDCSGTFQVLWDSQNLYIMTIVKDEALVRDSDPTQGWNDDRVEIFIDADNGKTEANTSGNDYQYNFSFVPDEVEPLEWYERSTGRSMIGVESAVSITDNGYRVEVKFPWSTILPNGTPGDYIGIGLAIGDDDDGGGRDSQVSSLIHQDGDIHSPILWGTGELLE